MMSSEQGVMLATAMATVSGTAFVILAIKLQKSISPSPDAQFHPDFTPHRSCIFSGVKKGDKKKKKKVRFAKDVVEPSGNNEEFRKRFSAQIERKNAAAGSIALRRGMPTGAPYLNGKEDITVIFRRRGGDDLEQSYSHWERTVKSSPDVIEMTFAPITSLIDDVLGKEYLSRAINLYLEYKPQMEELRYFLEFQSPRIWAPIQDRLVGLQRKELVCPTLQFSLMGQKLYISQEQISVGRKPVTGLRLCLEGAKQNRMSIHVQHLASLPKIFYPYWDSHVPIGPPQWRGPEEQDSRWFELVKWRNFSHVSTTPIESLDSFTADLSGAFVVTGAQLGVWDFGSRNVLYMKLLFSKLPGCTVRRSLWDHTPSDRSKKPIGTERTVEVGSSSSISNDFASSNKLVKFVDMSEKTMGPEDPPGHWLVTGGKLGVEKGKIALRVKYSLLNY